MNYTMYSDRSIYTISSKKKNFKKCEKKNITLKIHPGIIALGHEKNITTVKFIV